VRAGGAVSTAVASTLNNIALALIEDGQHQEALVRLKEALDIRLNLLGERDPQVSRPRHS
jgi:hypothetical protein